MVIASRHLFEHVTAPHGIWKVNDAKRVSNEEGQMVRNILYSIPRPQLELTSLYRTYLDNVRRNPGPFVSEDFTGSEEAVTASEEVKVL
jgi:hypothetical protein